MLEDFCVLDKRIESCGECSFEEFFIVFEFRGIFGGVVGKGLNKDYVIVIVKLKDWILFKEFSF